MGIMFLFPKNNCPFHCRGSRLGHRPSSIALLLLLVVAVRFVSSVRGDEPEPSCHVDNDCSASSTSSSENQQQQHQQHDSYSWFEDASNSEGIQFLKENVFGQRQAVKGKRKKRKTESATETNNSNERQESFSHLFHPRQSDPDLEDNDHGDKFMDDERSGSSSSLPSGMMDTLREVLSSEHPDEALLHLLLSQTAKEEEAYSFQDTAKLFMDHAQEVLSQFQRTFGDRLGDLVKDYFYIPSAWYLLRREQETKHAFWKAAKHRFCEKLTDINTFKELHQALYLADLAYVDQEPQIRQGLSKLKDGNWELLFVDTQGNPSEPAHFLAVEKQAAPLHTKRHNNNNNNNNNNRNSTEPFWQKAARRILSNVVITIPQEDSDSLKVLIVVRGTKTLADILSDGLLEAVDFKGDYKAHGGIQQSGHYIVEKHIGRLKMLLEASGRSKIKLLLFGHSLGCGTAAIAAMEFHDEYKDIISVQAVGFGCPSLVSPELSEKYQDIITTVINDADVIPRMSGASLVNLQLEMLSLDWTDYLIEELKELGADILKDVSRWTSGAGTNFAKDLLDKVGSLLEEHLRNDVKPHIEKAVKDAIPSVIKTPNQRLENELIPPGTCLHLYRTATGYDAAYTPCTFFNEIEYVPHMIQDHMTQAGYHFALLSLLRQQSQDNNAIFENVLVG